MHIEIKDSEPIVEETTFNVELLEQVRDYIVQHPDELDMDNWENVPGFIKREIFGCGTTRCIAGTAVHLAKQSSERLASLCFAMPYSAQRLLNLTYAQANRLFHVHNWPQQFQDRYTGRSKYSESDAWVTAERINHFIATNGEE